MLPNPWICTLVLVIIASTGHSQQLQWVLLTDGTSMDTPTPRRDAALGFDQSFLILFGGRGQNGFPLQDTYSFNTLTGKFILFLVNV
jgi:hypothetical protein